LTHCNVAIEHRPKFLILHLKRFLWFENKIAAPKETNENAAPNSPKPVQVEYVLKKMKDPVTLSETLDVTSFQAPDVSWSSLPSVYSLKSVVYHHGMRAESGHYTADAVRYLPIGTPQEDGVPSTVPTPVWVAFDDTSTALSSLEKVVSDVHKQERAYILLYALDDSS
jgi:ubiquitin carboxyl-terminal hydrolase 10